MVEYEGVLMKKKFLWALGKFCFVLGTTLGDTQSEKALALYSGMTSGSAHGTT